MRIRCGQAISTAWPSWARARLKGKEVAEVLGDRNFPSLDIKLLDDNESLGQLETVGDEVSFIQSVRSEQFEKVDFTFFASDQECTRQNWKKAQNAGSAIVDLSYALEDEPDAEVKSPWIQRSWARRSLRNCSPDRRWWLIPPPWCWRCCCCGCRKPAL